MRKKTKFAEISPKTVVLRPKQTKKNRIFRNLAQNSGFAAKTHKTTEFSQILPRIGQNKQNNINFRNLAQNRSKQPKKTNFQKIWPERVKTHQKTYFLRFCARTVVLQSKRTKKLKFQKSCPKQQFAVKVRKTNKHFRINAPNCPKHTFCLRIAISMVFWAKSKFLHVFKLIF